MNISEKTLDAVCYKCGSMSVIKDGLSWVCAEHISSCKCKRDHNHESEWDFRGVTIADMEFQMPAPDVPGYDSDGNWCGDKNPMPRWGDIDRKDDPEIEKWVNKGKV